MSNDVNQPLILNKWQRTAWRLAQACFLLVLFMIIVGAKVTTIQAGDTNPGWSWRFWEWIATWWASEGGRAYEDGHRVIGTVIGFVGIALAVAMWKGETGARRWLGVLALALIVGQGVLGGLRVLMVSDAAVRDTVLTMTGGGHNVELHRAVKAMIHGVIAQVIFASLACIAVVTSPRWIFAPRPQQTSQALISRKLAAYVLALLIVQLALGTMVRQTGQHVLLHVLGAFSVTLLVLWLLMRVLRYHGQLSQLTRMATLLGVLLVVQVFLGITPWVMTGGEFQSIDPFEPVSLMRSAHVTIGALVLAVTAVLTLWLYRLAEPSAEPPVPGKLGDYFILTKAKLSGLVMVTVAAGYLLASKQLPDLGPMAVAMLGVAMVAGGVAALNQYMERERDALMERTRNRPLPSGRMQPREAMAFGLLTVFGGTALLLFAVNWLAALLTFTTAVVYVAIYTPLKTRTTLNTLIGAIPGALPPLAGWAAATGELPLHAFALFAILYVWQLPHFWAIARLYREDYERGGMKMLSVEDRDGRFLASQIAVWCVVLTLISLLPVLIGMAGVMYGIGAVVLGLGFFGVALYNALGHTPKRTRAVFHASLIYLPLLLAVLIADVW